MGFSLGSSRVIRCTRSYWRCLSGLQRGPRPPSRRKATRILEHAKGELNGLNAAWQTWEELFGKSQLRMDLLNDRAVAFFGIVWDSMRHDVILGICRLTDPARRGRSSMSVEQLALCIETMSPAEHVSDLRDMIEDVRRTAAPLRVIRNRHLAHRDYRAALSPSLHLPGTSRDMISEALDALGEFLGNFEGVCLGGCLYGYNRSMMIPGGARELADSLKKSVEYEALEVRGEVSLETEYGGVFRDA